jgi:hypothetical protein
MPAIDLSILNQRQTPAFYADTLANRPAAGFVGRIFVSTNTFAFFRDNGTGWDLIGGPGTGTITGSGTSGQIALWDGASTITGDTGLTYNGTANSLTASQFIVTGGTSSQFLKADGSVDNNTYNTGSGVAGQVAFFSGTNAITGNNDLFWDNVNGHLGIGTNVPGTALQIDHDQSQLIRLNQTTATNDTKIAFQNSGTALWRVGNSYNAGANDFGIFDVIGAFQPVTVKKTTGQVLIGTSIVGSGKLVVASSIGDNGVQIVGAAAPSLRIDNAESGPTKRAGFGISTATNNFIQGSADRDFCMFNGSTTASPILFGIYDTTNVQEAARISAARNLLVGTVTDSGQKLIVNGTALISNSLLLGQTGVTNAVINSNDGMYFNIDSDSSGGTPEFMFGKQRNGAGSGGTTFMTISNAGNVGINTPTPTSAKLVVFSSDTTITMFGQNIDSSTTLGNAFVSRFRNGFDGNGLYSLTSFQVQNAAGTDQISFIGAQSVTGAGNYSPNTVIGVRSGASTFAEYMRIVGSTGNLLVNTQTDAGQKLQVNGNAAITSNLNLGFSGSGPTINTAGGLATVLNMNGGLIFNYQSSVPPPYTQNIIIDIVFGNWGSNPIIALVDLMATLREYASTSGIAYGKIFATSPSTSTFSTFDVSNITTSQSSVSASSGGSYTLRITINPTNNTDVFGIYMNIQTGGIGTVVSSITISYV